MEYVKHAASKKKIENISCVNVRRGDRSDGKPSGRRRCPTRKSPRQISRTSSPSCGGLAGDRPTTVHRRRGNSTTTTTDGRNTVSSVHYAVLQLSLTTQPSLYLMTDPAVSTRFRVRLRPTNQRLPPVGRHRGQHDKRLGLLPLNRYLWSRPEGRRVCFNQHHLQHFHRQLVKFLTTKFVTFNMLPILWICIKLRLYYCHVLLVSSAVTLNSFLSVMYSFCQYYRWHQTWLL